MLANHFATDCKPTPGQIKAVVVTLHGGPSVAGLGDVQVELFDLVAILPGARGGRPVPVLIDPAGSLCTEDDLTIPGTCSVRYVRSGGGMAARVEKAIADSVRWMRCRRAAETKEGER